MTRTVSIQTYLPQHLAAWVEEEARFAKQSRSQFIGAILTDLFQGQELRADAIKAKPVFVDDTVDPAITRLANPSAVIALLSGLSARRPSLTTSCRWLMADRTRTATSAVFAPNAISDGLRNSSGCAERCGSDPTGGRSGDRPMGGIAKSGGFRRDTALGPNFTQPRISDRGSETKKSAISLELTG